MTEELSLNDKLDKILGSLEEQQTKKKFDLPLMIRMRKGIFKKKNYAVVQIIRTNGGVSFKIVPIEDNTIKIGEVYHDASADYVLRYKNYPLLIIPEWSIKPFTPRENLGEAVESGALTSTEKFILTRMKMDAVKGKFNLNWGVALTIIGLIVGGLIILNYMKVI